MKLNFLSLVFLLASPALASTFIGNGGEGVIEGDQIRLLDFFENGISSDSFKCGDQINSQVSKLKINKMLFLSLDDQKCFSRALERLNELSPILSHVILQSSELYRWSLLKGEIKTSRVTMTYQKPIGELKTIAVRHLDGIRISKNSWSKMAPLDRAGLIIHELLYALLKLNCTSEEKGNKTLCSQDPILVRSLTAQIFSAETELASRRSQWISAIFADGLNESTEEKDLHPVLVLYLDKRETQQYAVFLRRSCNDGNSKSSCGLTSKEPLVRYLYKNILERSATDFEVYWWVDYASKLNFSCERLAKYFIDSSENIIFNKTSNGRMESSDKVCGHFFASRQ